MPDSHVLLEPPHAGKALADLDRRVAGWIAEVRGGFQFQRPISPC